MITLKQFATYLLSLPPEQQEQKLHCVQLCGSSDTTVKNLRLTNERGWGNTICIDDDGE